MVQIPFHIPNELTHGVSSELLEESISKNQSDHRFSDHAGGRNRAYITALHSRIPDSAIPEVHTGERLSERGYGLHSPSHNEWFPCRHPSFEPPRTVRRTPDSA